MKRYPNVDSMSFGSMLDVIDRPEEFNPVVARYKSGGAAAASSADAAASSSVVEDDEDIQLSASDDDDAPVSDSEEEEEGGPVQTGTQKIAASRWARANPMEWTRRMVVESPVVCGNCWCKKVTPETRTLPSGSASYRALWKTKWTALHDHKLKMGCATQGCGWAKDGPFYMGNNSRSYELHHAKQKCKAETKDAMGSHTKYPLEAFEKCLNRDGMVVLCIVCHRLEHKSILLPKFKMLSEVSLLVAKREREAEEAKAKANRKREDEEDRGEPDLYDTELTTMSRYNSNKAKRHKMGTWDCKCGGRGDCECSVVDPADSDVGGAGHFGCNIICCIFCDTNVQRLEQILSWMRAT
jgi:hypothetical protein